ncbi:RING-H2 finger protein ATL79 [Hibiscus syriacus]|uniref:RING-type E3 ubiquitin transferase n=1 Tax=Hibiscus syriacus TaxID=106335 RepID=A0A6A3A4J9_HIBSY|nr:RING-H2 finger protein ATL79-like [Hibiscus syriacus]KAE8698162.1 RING-H2 finger protein ATL79 [Hibiscus syriacus]
MRPPPSTEAAADTGERLVRLSPQLSSGEPEMSSVSESTCNPHTCRWRPYSNSNGFEANVAMVLIIFFCALICSLALNAAIRCFLSGGDRHRPRYSRNSNDDDNSIAEAQHQELDLQRKPVVEAAASRMVATPTVVYSTGTKLAGEESECAICLSEFVEGEGIQVLAKCNHGFHVQCIQQWLSSHSSCPTCRCICLSPPPSSEEIAGNSSRSAMPAQEP